MFEGLSSRHLRRAAVAAIAVAGCDGSLGIEVRDSGESEAGRRDAGRLDGSVLDGASAEGGTLDGSLRDGAALDGADLDAAGAEAAVELDAFVDLDADLDGAPTDAYRRPDIGPWPRDVGAYDAWSGPDAGPSVPVRIGTSIPTLELTPSCIDLLSGETLLDVGPEGQAWLGSNRQLRLIDVANGATTIMLNIAGFDVLEAQSGARAIGVASGGFWNVTTTGAQAIDFVAQLGTPVRSCGDVFGAGPAFMLSRVDSTISLFTLTAADTWSRLSFPGVTIAATDELGSLFGACARTPGQSWLRSADDVVVATASSYRTITGANSALTLLPNGTAARIAPDGDIELVDASSTGLEFGSPVQEMDVIGESLLVRARGEVIVVAPNFAAARVATGVVTRARGDAAHGLVTIEDGRLCRRQLAPGLRVDGIAPFSRLRTSSLAFDIRPTEGVDGVSVSFPGLGNLPVTSTARGFRVDTTRSGPVIPNGHHAIQLVGLEAGGPVHRTIEVEVHVANVSFQRDVAPLVGRYCAIAGCHDGAARMALTPASSWAEPRGTSILGRVSRGEMPPGSTGITAAERQMLYETFELWLEARLP